MDIGFYITNIEGSNKDQLLECVNNYVENNPYDNVVVFNDVFNAITNNKFYTLHISHAKYFKGTLFIFDIKDATIVNTFPAPKRKIFFATQAYWQNNKMVQYAAWNQIFNNSDMDIVVNNESMFDVYKMCWKEPIHIVPKISYEEIKHVLQK